MPTTIVAVVPHASDFALIEETFRGEDGIELRRASSPEEVLTFNQPSAILYDADFAHSWRVALPMLKRARPGSRIVLLCSSADHKTWVDLFDCGGWDLILKSLRPADVRLIIRNALDTANPLGSAA